MRQVVVGNTFVRLRPFPIVTLSVSLYRPPPASFEYVDVPELNGRDAAGFESYRAELWGSSALADRGSWFFSQLRNNDLFVVPDDFPAFRTECDWVYRDARSIAIEIWPYEWIDKWCPIKREARIRELRVRGARSIRIYIVRFLAALDIAEGQQLGFNIG